MSFFLPLFIPFFYPFLFPSRIFPLPYFSSTRLLSLTPIHLLTFSRVLRPTCANAIYLLTPHSFSYAYSLAPFLSCRYRLCPTRGLGRVLSSLDNLPPSPLYSVLPSRNRAENLRIEPSRALLSGRKKDRRIGGRYA